MNRGLVFHERSSDYMEIYGATSRKWGKDSEHIQFVHQFAKPTSAARLASSRMRAAFFGHEPSLAGAAKGVGCTVGVLSIVAQWRDDISAFLRTPPPACDKSTRKAVRRAHAENLGRKKGRKK